MNDRRTLRMAIAGIHIESSTFSPLYSRQENFTATRGAAMLGLDPLEHTVTVVKIGYLEPELKAMARHHLLVLSPGAVQPLLTTIDYQSLKRPVFPLDGNFEWTPVARVFPV